MTKKNLYWLWNASQGIRSRIVINSIAGICRVCMSLLFVWACKKLIDVATHNSDGVLWHYSILLIVTAFFGILLMLWSNRLEQQNNITLKNKLRHRLFSQLMLSRCTSKEHYHSGDAVNRLEEDVRITVDTFCSSFPSLLVTGFQLIAAFLFLAQLDIRLAFILIFIMPVFLLTSKLYMKRIHKLTKGIRTTDSKIQSHIQENLQYKTLIQAFEQSPLIIGKLGILQSKLYWQVMNRINFTLFSKTIVMAGFATGYIIAFLWGVNGIYEGVVSFGMMTAFLQLVGQIQRPVVELSRHIPAFAQAITSVERLIEVDEQPTNQMEESIFLEEKTGIKLENVSFAYSKGNQQVISNFSYDFAPESCTAILGETGVGKSTLVQLMLSLLYPQAGTIYIYNKNRKIKVGSSTLCNMVYVPQGNTLLSGTIRENLLLGNPNAASEQLYEALHTAAAEFVYNLPNGLDTFCGEKGAGLSEGQAQRICIARGLLRPGKILLLDEFSSALDKDTEHLLIERLISQTSGKTLIFITHREELTKFCEQIIRL